MPPKGPSYITLSANNIWYYQRWMPTRFRKSNSELRSIFRISLRTKNKNKALRIARALSVKLDLLAQDHFDDPKSFGKAMELLLKSTQEEADSKDFTDYEDRFLTTLDDYDEWLLDKGIKLSRQIQEKLKSLEDENWALKQALMNNGSKSPADLVNKIVKGLNPELPNDKNPTLQQLHTDWSEGAKKRMRTGSYEAASKAISLFIRFMDNYEGSQVRINKLTPEHIHYYQKYYEKIPVRTETDSLEISGLIKLTGNAKAPKTILDTYSTISSFFGWIETKGLPIDAKLQKVITKGSDIKADPRKTKQRATFGNPDLKLLFNSEEYTSSGKFKQSSMYWAPLIALFTGARMAEILQLEKHDILKENEGYFFKFDDVDPLTSDAQKHVKQDGSRRTVPIHKTLIELGIIDYIESQPSRLFPDEPRNEKGKFDAFQKRHANYRKKHKVCSSHALELKDFHSFRHTVRTQLSELRNTGKPSQRFDEGIIDAIVGHKSQGRSIGESTYNHSQYLSAKKVALNRLTYTSIDFDKILPWRKCLFARNAHREKVRAKLKK